MGLSTFLQVGNNLTYAFKSVADGPIVPRPRLSHGYLIAYLWMTYSCLILT